MLDDQQMHGDHQPAATSQMQKPPDVLKMAAAWFCQQVTSWVQLQWKIAITTGHNTNCTK